MIKDRVKRRLYAGYVGGVCACHLVGAAVLLTAAEATANDVEQQRSQCEREHAVRIGHAGKDVIWVPTHDKLVTAMLAAADASVSDYVIDLGSGDGKIPISAARDFGSKSLGVEYDPQMVLLGQCYVRAAGLNDKVEIREADIFETDFTNATIITMYLLPQLNMRLRPQLLELAPGTRIVSNRFKLGRWQPDEVIRVAGVANEALLWVVPARVEGIWRLQEQDGARQFRIRIGQEFQEIHGKSLTAPRRELRNLKLRGSHIQFVLNLGNSNLNFVGEAVGSQMKLIAHSAGTQVPFIGARE